jgi:hypothetical protein
MYYRHLSGVFTSARHARRRSQFRQLLEGVEEVLNREGMFYYYSLREFLFEVERFSKQSASYYTKLVERLLLPRNIETRNELINMQISYKTAFDMICLYQSLLPSDYDFLYGRNKGGRAANNG